MREYQLKYGCNPNQKQARVYMKHGELPFKIINGNPGYINLLDALNAWQLVKELNTITEMPAAASFKHVSPAGAAIGKKLSQVERMIYWIEPEEELSSLASAYARARGTDRMSSYGDFIALSDTCDISTARLIQHEFSDGIIAPGYEAEALRILSNKKNGNYCILQIDQNYIPTDQECKDVYGITFEQQMNNIKITKEVIQNCVTENNNITEQAVLDLMIAMTTLKFTQSNSVCLVKDGQTIGVGAGQQSRIHCTRLATQKAESWFLRQNPKVLGLKFHKTIKRVEKDNWIEQYVSNEMQVILEEDDWKRVLVERPVTFLKEEKVEWIKKMQEVSLASDAFFPFGDNVERAYRSGVKYIVQPGGSLRDEQVIETCNKHNIAMIFTGIRLFYH